MAASVASIPGIHHVTCITGDVQKCVDFYVGVLGLRFIKKSINQDLPDTYHIYFGDNLGTPGTAMTFFGWPTWPKQRAGSGQITSVSFQVPPGSLGFWSNRLNQLDVDHRMVSRLDADALVLHDPDGIELDLVAQASKHRWTPWRDSPTQEGSRTRFETGAGGPHAIVDVVEAPEGPVGEESIGTVHHVAWRTPDPDTQVAWRDTLLTAGRNVTPVIDRWYFKSIYYREPGGVLFEIATDGPGFTIDEPPEKLGTTLSLPPWFQVRRDQLDEILPPIVVPTTATTGAH